MRRRVMARWVGAVMLIGLAPVMGSPPGAVPTTTTGAPPTMTDTRPRDFPGLHNVVAYHDGYYSGSVPEGDAGFDTLARLGVKTIISVDGAEPEVQRAKARGIRYVHLPIGYNGFDEKRKLELARASRDAMKAGPVYVHCHHGKHRSAGAAGTAIASLGLATPGQMVERMKVSGTAAGYKGLYACTAGATVLPAAAIEAVSPDPPEVSRPSGLVRGMIEVDEVFEQLKAIEKAGWRVPADHPDLVPAAAAGRLADLFRILAETERVRTRPADFLDLMREQQARAQALEDHLLVDDKDAAGLSARFRLVTASCKDCHVKYRD